MIFKHLFSFLSRDLFQKTYIMLKTNWPFLPEILNSTPFLTDSPLWYHLGFSPCRKYKIKGLAAGLSILE